MPQLAAFLLQKINWLDNTWKRVVARARHNLLRRLVHARSGRRFEFIRTRMGEFGISGRGERIISPQKRLSVVIVTYQQPDELACLLYAFATQTLQNFEIHVLHDGPHAPTRAIVERFIAEHPSVPCKYRETDRRYNDYGHTLRQIGIEEAGCEFILITNGDNYYVPRFVELTFDGIDQSKLDLVLFDMVHSHFAYIPFSTAPMRWNIDMGSIVVRTAMAKRVGFRDKGFEGDATFIEDLLRDEHGPRKVGKLCRTLFVHN